VEETRSKSYGVEDWKICKREAQIAMSYGERNFGISGTMRLVEQEFDIDQKDISKFFPLEETATTMLGIFASLLGLQFTPVPADKLKSTIR
jgi:hypothetical protein